jgi:branched-chain amino acid transport system substrate-binding protein
MRIARRKPDHRRMPMVWTRWRLAAATVAAIVVAAGCSSGSSSGSSSGGKPTYTVGVLTDLSGPGANTGGTTPQGIKAGVGMAAHDGYTIKYVIADTGSSPAGALTAAQKLVEQDHVFAVIALSGLTFAAAPYLSAQHVPVVGAAFDGSEWIKSPNMFSVIGTGDVTKVWSTYGLIFKKLGVTNLGTLGYGVVPASTDAATGSAVAAKAVGVKVGYINANFPLGSTNVAPVALAMKAAEVNGVITSIETNGSFALVTALKQDGVRLKGAVLPTGYGGDLVEGGPGAEQAAQGVYFLSTLEPVEMHTAATEQLQSALRTYAGVTGDPTFAEYLSYAAPHPDLVHRRHAQDQELQPARPLRQSRGRFHIEPTRAVCWR